MVVFRYTYTHAFMEGAIASHTRITAVVVVVLYRLTTVLYRLTLHMAAIGVF